MASSMSGVIRSDPLQLRVAAALFAAPADAPSCAGAATMWYDPASYVLDEFDAAAQRISFVLAKHGNAVTSLP